jgi:hypothetical protein
MKEYLNKLRKPMLLVDKAASLNREDLLSLYSQENIKFIQLLLPELVEDEFVPNKVTSTDFAEILYKCCKARKEWGKSLGNVIIEADKLVNNGKKDLAIQCLDDFVVSCSAPYFRKHAENQIKFYQRGEHSGRSLNNNFLINP